MDTTRRGFLASTAAATGAAVTQDLAHAADGGHDHQIVPSELALRTKSLESLLVEKGLVDPAALDEIFGSPTVTDILRELEKPGRDPRPAFKAAVFKDGLETLNDSQPGMVLEGAVTNVAAFGRFVDVGCTRMACARVGDVKTFGQGSSRGGEARRHRSRQGAGGRHGASAPR